jgi:hypothetical protein
LLKALHGHGKKKPADETPPLPFYCLTQYNNGASA